MPHSTIRPRCFRHLFFETTLIFVVLAIAAILSRDLAPASFASVVFMGGLFCIGLLLAQWQHGHHRSSREGSVVRFAVFSLLLGVLLFFGLRFSGSTEYASALLVPEGVFAVPAAFALWKWFSSQFDVLSCRRERILIIGTGEKARQLRKWVADTCADDYDVAGFADETSEHVGTLISLGNRVVTDFESLHEYAGNLDRVIVALDEKRGKLPVRALMNLRLGGIEIERASSFLERVSGRISVEHMLPSWLIFSRGFRASFAMTVLKRCADVLISLLLLVLAAPVMACAAAAVALDSRGPVLFSQLRVGKDGRPFRVLKFRSMIVNAEESTGPTWARLNDPRVTRVGRILRKLRIDELPQIFNVLRGEMSLVGPRPERPEFVAELEQAVPYYGVRHRIRPGITGWAQVSYGYGADEDDALEKLRYDVYYVKNHGMLFDMKILFKTVKVVLTAAGAR